MTDSSSPSRASGPSRILILTYTPIDREPRALKQIDLFSARYDVTTAGFGNAPRPNVPHIQLDDWPHSSIFQRLLYLVVLGLRLHRFVFALQTRNSSALKRLSGHEWDIIVAHDVQTVPLAHRLQPKIGVLVDLHEYAPRQNEYSWAWRLLIAPYFRWVLRNHVVGSAAVTTVGQGIVDEYRKEFGIASELVVNATPFQQLDPTPVSTPIRLVHSGIPAPARKLDVMIDAVRDSTADVTLDLYLIKDGSKYYEELRARALGNPRVRFMDPVPYADLITTLNQYDVGLSVIAPTTFNLAWCLPNKFFDFIQARLGVIVGPSPEMTRFVRAHELGEVTRDFSADALRETLDGLTQERVESWKHSSSAHARELSSEEQVKVWDEIVTRMVSGQGES